MHGQKNEAARIHHAEIERNVNWRWCGRVPRIRVSRERTVNLYAQQYGSVERAVYVFLGEERYLHGSGRRIYDEANTSILPQNVVNGRSDGVSSAVWSEAASGPDEIVLHFRQDAAHLVDRISGLTPGGGAL